MEHRLLSSLYSLNIVSLWQRDVIRFVLYLFSSPASIVKRMRISNSVIEKTVILRYKHKNKQQCYMYSGPAEDHMAALWRLKINV